MIGKYFKALRTHNYTFYPLFFFSDNLAHAHSLSRYCTSVVVVVVVVFDISHGEITPL